MDKLAIGRILIDLIDKWEAACTLKRQVAEKNAMMYALAAGKADSGLDKLILSRCEFYSASELEHIIGTIKNLILLQDDELSKLVTSRNANRQQQTTN